MPTFPASPVASQQSSGETKPRTNVVQFGEGYMTRIPEAINNLPKNYNLQWKKITTAEHTTLADFLEARNASESFDYTVPGDGAAKKFICKTWRWTYVDDTHVDFSASFEQVFEG